MKGHEEVEVEYERWRMRGEESEVKNNRTKCQEREDKRSRIR
jgi:hypothetical protein